MSENEAAILVLRLFGILMAVIGIAGVYSSYRSRPRKPQKGPDAR